MKKLLIGLAIAAAGLVFAANWQGQSGLTGITVIYQATTNATVFYTTNGWVTNTVVTNAAGTAIIPYSTNSSTGSIYPSLARDMSGFANSIGDAAGNSTISITYRADSALSNAIVWAFSRSVDGTNFATNTADVFLFTNTPQTTLQTFLKPVPASFMTGTKAIRFESISLGTNMSGSAAILRIYNMTLGGWVP